MTNSNVLPLDIVLPPTSPAVPLPFHLQQLVHPKPVLVMSCELLVCHTELVPMLLVVSPPLAHPGLTLFLLFCQGHQLPLQPQCLWNCKKKKKKIS